MRRFGSLVLCLALAACASPPSAPSPNAASVAQPVAASQTLTVKLIAFNDFHGNLEPPGATLRAPANNLPASATSEDVLVPAGGVARFAAMVKALGARNPNHAIVSSGDMIGASPLVSALFLDEPTIEAMNMIGVDFNSVGNHEFDRGVDELKRKQTGGCARYVAAFEPCRGGHGFEGARFQYLAANVVDRRTGQPLFPAYGVKTFEGVKVGFIGLTLKGTDLLVDPSGIKSVRFLDETTTIRARAAELRAQGVNTIVVLIHQGGYPAGRLDPNGCVGLTGDILPIVDGLEGVVDVVASAHTHQPYVCNYRGILLTSAAAFGRLVTDIDLEIDRGTGKVLRKSAVNRIVASEALPNVPVQAGYPLLEPDADISRHVQAYVRDVAPFANRKIGSVAAPLSNRTDAAGQSALGEVIADASLEATRAAGARIAFFNRDSVRAPVANGAGGFVVYDAIFRAQPFGNNLVTITLSGAEIRAVLEQQWLPGREQPQTLQVSRGFNYAYDASRPIGSRVIPESMRLEGRSVDPAMDYRVTVNSYMASGGDGFALLLRGRDPVVGAIDVDATEAYFATHSPVALPEPGRVRMMGK